MNEQKFTHLQQLIQERWGKKVTRYVGKFRNRERREEKITAVVGGNHGDYKVSIEAGETSAWSTCSCYIGKGGYCHHCAALGLTFLAEPTSFVLIEKVEKTAVDDLTSLQQYLNSTTLDELTKQMRAKGITQKAFCEAVGMVNGR